MVKKKYFGVGLQVVVQDTGGDGEVSSAEGVVMVPPLGTKFTALRNACMKKAEGEEHGVELLLSGAQIQSVLKRKRASERERNKHK